MRGAQGEVAGAVLAALCAASGEVDLPPVAARVPPVGSAGNHAMHRHAEAVSLARAIAAQMERAPQVVHGQAPAGRLVLFRIR